jgi:hypothetical protein
MIVSHKYKFIFIKTAKTAGTSTEIALSKFCGPDDIITPFMVSEDEELRERMGGRAPQHYLPPRREHTLKAVIQWLWNGKRKPLFNSHDSAQVIKTYVGTDVYDTYFKFCFERNPWDRVISHYYYKNPSEPRPTLAQYMAVKRFHRLKRAGFDLYTINGEVVVDRICRFENLADELEDVRRQLGIPEKLALPFAKSQFRVDRRSYRDILDDDQRVQIAEFFKDEINLMGYEF